MKSSVVLMVVWLGVSTCAGDAELAKAERLQATRTAVNPATSAVAQAWQASYAAETAGQIDAALLALSQLPSPQNGSYLAILRSAWLHYRLGRYDESVAAYNTAIMLDPNAVEARVAQLLPLMAQQKWDAVVRAAEEVLKHDPENYLTLQRLAFAKFSSQHFPEAEQLYRHLVQRYPSDLELRASLGWAVLRMGKQKEAVALFSSVLEHAGTHAIAASGLQVATAHRKAK